MPSGALKIPLTRGIPEPCHFAHAPSALAENGAYLREACPPNPSSEITTMTIHEIGNVIQDTKFAGVPPGDSNLGLPA